MAKMRSKWGRVPRRGTKANDFFRLLLREKGALLSDYDGPPVGAASVINSLRDNCGFDIRAVGSIPRGKGLCGARRKIYRIVGRSKWDAGYVSFIKLTEIPDF